MLRRLLIVAACAASTTVIGGPAADAAPAAPAAACSSTIQISSLTFDRTEVAPGQTVTATVVAQNCTTQSQRTTVQLLGRLVGPAAGIPAGCQAIDPLAQQATFAPGGQFTTSIGYLIFSSCTATSFEFNVRITGASGVLLAEQTISLPVRAAAKCTASYEKSSEWRDGFVALVTVRNVGAVASHGWSVAFTFAGDQQVVNSWNAAVTQSGSAVSAVNRSFNGSLAPGSSAVFGILGTWHTSDAAPASLACQLT